MNEQTAAQTPESDSPATAPIHVIATTLEGTRAALVVAKRLTAGVHAPIRLIIPVLTSFLGRIDPDYNGTAVIEEHQALAGSVDVRPTVLFCVCKRYEDIADSMLSPSSLVIVGGCRGTLWTSREQRLVSRLSARGFPVVFAQVGAGWPGSHVAAL